MNKIYNNTNNILNNMIIYYICGHMSLLLVYVFIILLLYINHIVKIQIIISTKQLIELPKCVNGNDKN